MRIAIIGTGHIGGGLAQLFHPSSHEIILGARDREAIPAVEKRFPKSRVEIAAEAMNASDAIVLAVPWSAAEDVLSRAGSLAGKVLLDTTNPLLHDLSGLSIAADRSAAEIIQQWKSEAHVIKAFNTLGAGYLGRGLVAGSLADGFYFGNDSEAKERAAELITLAGLHPCDVWPLKNAR